MWAREARRRTRQERCASGVDAAPDQRDSHFIYYSRLVDNGQLDDLRREAIRTGKPS